MFEELEAQFPELAFQLSCWADQEDEEMVVVDYPICASRKHARENPFADLEALYPNLASPLVAWSEQAEEEAERSEQLQRAIELSRVPLPDYLSKCPQVTEIEKEAAAIYLKESRERLCGSGVHVNSDAINSSPEYK